MKRIISSILVLAMLLTIVPVAFAETPYQVSFDSTEYNVAPGGTVEVPVYLSAPDGSEVKLTLTQVNVGIPTGFSATVTGDAISDAKIKGSDVVFFKDSTDTPYSKGQALGKITFTAPSVEGTYDLVFTKVELFDADYLQYDNSTIAMVAAKIIVKDSSTTPTVEKITANPTALTVPYENQSDIEGYVKGNVVVTATYSDASTKAVTDYAVSVEGTTATITYEGKTATVALTLAPKPEEPSKYDYVVQLDKTSYEVEAGGTFEVPVYLSAPDGGEVKVTLTQINVGIPDGFSATVAAGTISDAKIKGSDVVFFKDSTDEVYSKANAIGTITFTAPSKAGNYELRFTKVELFDAGYLQYDASIINAIGATITVTGGSTPAKVLDSIEISSAADPIVIPYGADAEETIRKAITVKAIYSNAETEDNVTGYDVAIDENVATISYTVDGTTKTATINIKYQPTPVLTVEKSEITVPYGTEDVEAYVKAEIKSGKVKLDETDLTFDDYVIEFTNGADTATVKYAKDETITATVSVKYVELDKINVVIKGDGTEVKIPWDSTDDATAVKALITVTAVFTNGAHDNEITNYTVDFGEGTFTVSYGGLTSEPIPYSKDAKPEAKVTGIKAEPTELNVPYANTVSNDEIIKFVKANVKVTATYDDESTSDVAEYGVTIADDKATITYEGFTADVTLVKETRKLELSNTEITVDEGTDKDGIIAYVKANVTAKYVYSQTTAEQTIPVDELAITVNDELTEVTVEVGGESAKIAVNIKVVPNFVETVKADTNAYGIATAKLVIFTDVKDGKVVKVTDEKGTYDAIYMGNGKWAAVVTGSYTAFADNGSLPEAAKFGRLHDASMITAYDALLTLLKANNGAVNVFDNDYQKYLLADVDGNGTLTADEALYINRISLGNADESTLWFNK